MCPSDILWSLRRVEQKETCVIRKFAIEGGRESSEPLLKSCYMQQRCTFSMCAAQNAREYPTCLVRLELADIKIISNFIPPDKGGLIPILQHPNPCTYSCLHNSNLCQSRGKHWTGCTIQCKFNQNVLL